MLLDHLIATLPPGISQNPASQASLRRNAEADLNRSEARRNTIQKHWLALSTPADRLEFYRDHEYEILRNWPGDLLSMASIVQSEQINLDPEESISALIGRATAASAIGDRGLAEMLEKELADHFRETEPDANYVDFLHGISHQLRLREPVAAEPRSRMAIRLARRLGLGSPSMWWRMWATRASILGKLGKTRLSRHYLVRALRLARKTWQEQRNPASAADIADILVMVMDIHSSRGEAKKSGGYRQTSLAVGGAWRLSDCRCHPQ